MGTEKEAAFDPYHRWLGISKAHRPPTHYQLLSLSQGESDVEVIEEAAIRQTTHLRAYQVGPHADDCTKLLNEVSAARQVLVNPQKRQEYDGNLAQLAAMRAAARPAEKPATAAAPIFESAFVDLGNDDGVAAAAPRRDTAKPTRSGKSGKRPASKAEAKRFAQTMILAAAGCGGLLIVGIVALIALAVSPTIPRPAPAPPNNPQQVVEAKAPVIEPRPAVEPKPAIDTKPPVVAPNPLAAGPTAFRHLQTFYLKAPAKVLVPTGDGRLFYGGDPTILQFEPARDRHLSPLLMPDTGPGGVRVAVSPDGNTIYVAMPDKGSLDAYECVGDKKRLLGAFDGAGELGGIELSRDGTMLVSGSTGGDVIVWNTSTRKQELQLKKHSGNLLAFGFSRDGTLAASLSDKEIQVWNVREKRVVKAANNIVAAVALDFSSDGKSLILATPNGLMAGSINDFGWVTIVPKRGIEQLECVDEKSFDAMTRNSVGLYDWPSGKTIRSASVANDSFRTMCLSPDGRLMFVGCVNNRLEVLATDERAVLQPFVPSMEIPNGGAPYVGTWHFPLVPSQTEIDIDVRKDGNVLSAQIKVKRLTLTGKAQVSFLRMTDKLRGPAIREGELPAPWTTLREIVFDPPDAAGEMNVTFHCDGERNIYAFNRPERMLKEPPPPDHKAVPTPPSLPSPKTGPTPVARLDPPGAQKAKELTAAVRDTYKADYAKKTPADRADLAEKLLKLATESKDDPAARYVLCCEARDIAAAAGNWSIATDAIERIGDGFKVDVLPLKEAALLVLVKSGLAKEAAAEATEAALQGVGDAIAADQLTLAGSFLKIASSAAARSQSVPHLGLFKKADAELKLVRLEAEAVKNARETLKTMPEDPAANLAVGRYEALRRGDWDSAIPLLAKGGDGDLGSVARKELAAPADGAGAQKIGDDWWSAAEKLKAESPWTRTALRNRAALWYRRALPQATGLALAVITERLKTIDEAPSPFHLGGTSFTPEKTLSGHRGSVTALYLTPDGKRLVSGSLDGTVKFWDMKQGKQLTTYSLGGPIYGLAFSPNGRSLLIDFKAAHKVVDGDNPSIPRINLTPAVPGAFWLDNDQFSFMDDTKHLIHSLSKVGTHLPMSIRKNAIVSAPDRMHLVTLGEETWSFNMKDDGDVAAKHKTVLEASTAATFSPKFGLVAVATANKKIGVYDYNRQIVALTLEAGTITHCLAYSPNGDRLLSGGDDGVVHIWDVGAGKELRRFATGSKGVTALILTPDGKQVITGGSDGVIRVWPEKS